MSKSKGRSVGSPQVSADANHGEQGTANLLSTAQRDKDSSGNPIRRKLEEAAGTEEGRAALTRAIRNLNAQQPKGNITACNCPRCNAWAEKTGTTPLPDGNGEHNIYSCKNCGNTFTTPGRGAAPLQKSPHLYTLKMRGVAQEEDITGIGLSEDVQEKVRALGYPSPITGRTAADIIAETVFEEAVI